MTNNSFVAVVPQQHNTRGSNTTQDVPEQGNSGKDWLPTVWKATTYLAVTFALLLAEMALEWFFGVFSGFTLLFGPYPAMGFAALLSFGVAVYCVFFWRTPTWPTVATGSMAMASETPRPRQWKVRTTPRPQRARGAASRRVMDMEV